MLRRSACEQLLLLPKRTRAHMPWMDILVGVGMAVRLPVPRIPTKNANANLAVELFQDILQATGWGRERAWLAIAKLLMTCDVWEKPAWRAFYDFPVLMERNNYTFTSTGDPNTYMRDAELIAEYLASELGISRALLCSELAVYFRHPKIMNLQPNNVRGHAFRSLIAEALALYGDSALTISEEQSPHGMFPGFPFPNRSKNARIDIVVRRGALPVALLSTRWTYRHDRVEMIDEGAAYIPAARSVNPRCVYYGVTAEVSEARLKKVISATEPVVASAAIKRLVHLKPELASSVIGNNSELKHLISLEQLCLDSFDWH